MKYAIYIFSFVVLISTFLDLRIKETDRRLSLALVRIFFIVPVLIATYMYAYFSTDEYIHPYFYHTENYFALLWVALGNSFHHVISSKRKDVSFFWIIFSVLSVVVVMLFGYDFINAPAAALVDDVIFFSLDSIAYCSAMLLLGATLFLEWRLEAFWRSLNAGDRWRYKYLVVGLFLICVILVCSCSYRLAYLRVPRDHLLIQGILFTIAWITMGYALTEHRLLNRKLFISRKVVYASITPIVFSIFFILIGLMSLASRLFDWTVPYALQWLVIVLGTVSIVVLASSRDIRSRIKYFISTHFYVNKYEYRDEWLAFSDLLQGKLTEKGIVEALYQILRDSLYSRTILIWLGNTRKGFQLIDEDTEQRMQDAGFIAGDDAIVRYLLNAPYLYSQEGNDNPLRHSILRKKKAFLKTHDIVLIAPLILGSQCVGLIGLGPETTGGRYGHDDFDLLTALSSHAASALLAIQNAEKLARAREQSAWSNLSAFVLHDIKNAATMLDLVRKNAGQHMDNPEFQQDMLESIDDALKRMSKVQSRLSTLHTVMVAHTRTLVFGELLTSCVHRLSKKLPALNIVLEGTLNFNMETDPDFVYQILENLLINAFEAGGKRAVIRIQIKGNVIVQMDIQDNGPGIPPNLLPQALFAPFKTSKPNGSGIGLWQVRQIVERLGGNIQVRNSSHGGAIFSILFPNPAL